MITRLYIPVYALTLLLSAFLIFAVQPLFAKMILPLLGGGPSVWNISMLFFQAALLAGYAYAHGIARYINIRLQTIIHIFILVICAFALPIAIPAEWEPPSAQDFPALSQLTMMVVAIGGPFFVLAASAPLLQHWFSHTDHPQSQTPYFLYAVSNFGSMTALVSYPIIIEPLMTLSTQKIMWSQAYMGLIILTLSAALLVLRHYKTIPLKQKEVEDIQPVSWGSRTKWLWLSFIPSSLLLGTTTYITTDVASVPLLWIVPLILYLSTFIIAFSHIPYSKYIRPALVLHTILLIGLIFIFMKGYFYSNIYHTLFSHFALFFVSALICHAELAKIKPHPKYLTEFYLIISVGGVLGGIFNSLLAPLIFNTPVEYPLMLGLAALARFQTVPGQSWNSFRKNIYTIFRGQEKTHWSIWVLLLTLFLTTAGFYLTLTNHQHIYMICIGLIIILLIALYEQRWAFATAVTCLLLIYPVTVEDRAWKLLHIERNYFGILKVYSDTKNNTHIALHNTTNHGIQSLSKDLKGVPLAYYHPTTASGDVFSVLDKKPSPQNVAAIGLGIGSIACYNHPERYFDFYEINPAMVRIAENKELFTALSDCKSPYEVFTGDGRIQISKASNAKYDMIFLDAFSSDAIPVHLITYEAFQTYLDKLKHNGFIAVHITNRHLSLGPVLYSIAKELGIEPLYKVTKPKNNQDGFKSAYITSFVIFTRDKKIAEIFKSEYGWINYPLKQHPKVWTDDYANILVALRKKDTHLIGLTETHKQKPHK